MTKILRIAFCKFKDVIKTTSVISRTVPVFSSLQKRTTGQGLFLCCFRLSDFTQNVLCQLAEGVSF